MTGSTLDAHVLFPITYCEAVMGKRKMHTQTYFQCDWTGLPMRSPNCYMPTWKDDKLVKQGSYCCWEAVVAHAQDTKKDAELDAVQQYINNLVGCTVQAAPHWSSLEWFSRDEDAPIKTPAKFLSVCSKNLAPVVAVRLQYDGTSHEVCCSNEDIKSKFEQHLTRPFNIQGPLHEPQSFQTVRKKANKDKDRDLTVFYWPFKNGLPFNQTASNIFKMQIYGDVLIINQTKEPCFLPRERYVNYFHTTFEEQFLNKSAKRKADPDKCLSNSDYENVKAEMESTFAYAEGLASSSASMPADLAKASVMQPPTGKELAKLLLARGQSPPLKRTKVPASPLAEA